MNRYIAWTVLLVAFVLGTAFLGWWTVPVVAGVWGGATPQSRKPWRSAALAAAVAWVLLLAASATRGPLFELVRLLGGIFGLPGLVVVLLALIFPALLAWGAAGLVSALQVALRERTQSAAAD